jgi:hypothetical protein
MFFFEKKNQETFVPGSATSRADGLENKSLLLLFFRKEGISSFFLAFRRNPHLETTA